MTAGALVVVGTPIGNLGDLSPRAVEALARADVICCEDTRHTRKLLTHAGITAKVLVAVHDHNESAQVRRVMDMVAAGRRVALVTDAGMPAISDPGERVVAAVSNAGLPVEVVPGPTALTTALAVSGLPTGRFSFEGFLPRKGPDRAARLAAVAGADHTSVIYEAPHRVRDTVDDLAAACGPLRRVALVRELTKLHEEAWRGSLEAAAHGLAEREPRGEYVIVVDAAPPRPVATDDDVVAALGRQLDAGASRRDAVTAVVEGLAVPKRRVFDLAAGLERSAPPGTLHHVEVNVAELARSTAFWSWFLERLGYVPFQSWAHGHSWRLGPTYVVITQTEPSHLNEPFHRKRTGLNHLAFHAASAEQVDEVTDELRARGVRVLYQERHPRAGGPEHYAVFFEDPDRIKVELVAPLPTS